jgi:hypothetical protein
MMMLVVHVEDCIQMKKRKKWHEWIKYTFSQVWYYTTRKEVVDVYYLMCDDFEDSDDNE